MFRKTFFIPALILILMFLSACSAVQLPWAATKQAQGSTSQEVKNKLALGILMMENTDLSVSKTQAQDLLFLWKGIKSLSTDNNTPPLEIAAIYDQIQKALTTQQVQAIKDMNISQDDILGLTQKYGSSASVSSSKKSTTTSSGQGGPGGDPMMGPPPGGDPSMGGGSTTTTKTSGSVKSSSSQVNYNLLFADSVIKALNMKTGNS